MQVRSCTLDTWLPEQVEFMERTGNLAANAYFEARLDPELKPVYGSADLQPFIFRKVSLSLSNEFSLVTNADDAGSKVGGWVCLGSSGLAQRLVPDPEISFHCSTLSEHMPKAAGLPWRKQLHRVKAAFPSARRTRLLQLMHNRYALPSLPLHPRLTWLGSDDTRHESRVSTTQSYPHLGD